jgi:DNA-binding transcriptional MerR regulator
LANKSKTGEVAEKLYFRIGEVAQNVGVDAHVLRYWESEFKMKPHRSSSGQRLYRKQDLSEFHRIKHLLHDEGYTIAGARKVLSGGGQSNAVDNARVKAALKRVEKLRNDMDAFRERIANTERS